MVSNLRPFDRAVRLGLGASALFVAFVLFHNPLAVVVTAFVAIYLFAECVTGICPLYRRLGVETEKDRLTREATFFLSLAGVQAVIAYEWLSAGWEKLSSSGAFVKNIADNLTRFASQNPYPWYKNFLSTNIMPDATLFAYLVEWSQVAVGVSLLLSLVLYIYSRSETWRRGALLWAVCALVGGLLMNLNFYLAAAWTSPGSHGVNVIMFWSQAALLYAWAYRLLIAKPSPNKDK